MNNPRANRRPPQTLCFILVLLVTAAVAGCRRAQPEVAAVPPPDYWPTEGWRTASPEAQGFRSGALADGVLAIRDDGTRVHSVIAIRDGYKLLDATYYPYDGSTYHDLASVTKSVTTTLIGIAADRGLLDLDAPMVSFFPDRTIANLEERKQAVTVRHLVGLTSGLACDPEGDEGDLTAMRSTEDWLQAALDRPNVAAPGSRFVYCGPDMHILSGIVQQVAGMTALEFAQAHLFGPLGITEVYWATDLQGRSRGWGDLSLFPEDAAKLGLLFQQGGRWEDQQVVSQEWVTQATTAHASTGRNWAEDYGYGWWVSRKSEEIPYFSANGRGGQYVRVFPGLNVIVATTGGGFSDMADVTDYLGGAIGDLENPLPEDPTGLAQLEAAIHELTLAPTASPVPPLPEMAKAVTGRTYRMEASPMPIESIRLDFDGSDQAVAYLKIAGEDGTRMIPVGLDGVDHMGLGVDGHLLGARGVWTADDTFTLEYD
jgi:CubicO group peptidase (beta-lactamase class C family)